MFAYRNRSNNSKLCHHLSNAVNASTPSHLILRVFQPYIISPNRSPSRNSNPSPIIFVMHLIFLLTFAIPVFAGLKDLAHCDPLTKDESISPQFVCVSLTTH